MTLSRTCCYGLVASLAWLAACAPQRRQRPARVTSRQSSTPSTGQSPPATHAAAMRLIAPDAVFVESGKIETRAEYEANHLPADIDFERQVKAERGPLRVTFDGRDTAWVISRAESRRR